jgi:ribonuclease T1
MIKMRKTNLYFVLIAVVFFFIGRFSNKVTEKPHYQEIQYNHSKSAEGTQDNRSFDQKSIEKKQTAELKTAEILSSRAGVPQKALEVLIYIRKNNKAPDGYVGGRTFQNRERLLPQKDENGDRIVYNEWDIYPKIKGRNRGAERLVTSDFSAYYTGDHYRSFIKIKE